MALEEETSGQADMTSVPMRRSARIRCRQNGLQFQNCDNENAPTTSRKRNCPIPDDEAEQPPSKICIGLEYQAELPVLRPISFAALDHDEAELVSEPLEQEGVGKGSDEWSMEEKMIFSKGMSRHGKDFWKIHTMIQSKTTAQCVTFYYNNKKHVKISRKKNLIFRDNESKSTGQTPIETRASTSRKRQRREGQEEMAKKRRK
ncbi:hypothetical protein XELAEV_18016139mg [Xenopus laevis]|uniref:SANT domain-containing protein n=1 Tax=Xenopus laevis TaxID=8355 RepID=A0A974DLT3_XENLA|nr:hypothetical protein XELAEV_18016139mg [Xenopus laevis]